MTTVNKEQPPRFLVTAICVTVLLIGTYVFLSYTAGVYAREQKRFECLFSQVVTFHTVDEMTKIMVMPIETLNANDKDGFRHYGYLETEQGKIEGTHCKVYAYTNMFPKYLFVMVDASVAQSNIVKVAFVNM